MTILQSPMFKCIDLLDLAQLHTKPNLSSLQKTIGTRMMFTDFVCYVLAISKFSEAIIDYIANIDKAPDPSVKKEMFSSEIFSAYDVIFNVWIQSKEMKVKTLVLFLYSIALRTLLPSQRFKQVRNCNKHTQTMRYTNAMNKLLILPSVSTNLNASHSVISLSLFEYTLYT